MNNQLHDRIQQIYSTIEQPDNWQDVIEDISKDLNGNHGFIGARSSLDDRPLEYFVSGFDKDYFDQYNKHYYSVDVWTKSLAYQKVNRFHKSHEAVDDKVFLASEIYADFAKPAEIRHSTGCLMVSQDQSIITEIAFFRNSNQGHFDDDAILQANTYLPHIQQSLEIAEKINLSQTSLNDSVGLFEHDHDAVLICRTDGTLLYHNPSAEQLFKSGTLKTPASVQLKLQFFDANDQQRFQQACIDCTENLLQGNRFYFNRHNNQYRVSIKPWQHSEVTPIGKIQTAVAMVRIQASATQLKLTAKQIAEYFPISPAEARACADLCDGLMTNEIAEKYNISIHTARDYIKASLSKTGSRNQAELVNKIIRHFAVK